MYGSRIAFCSFVALFLSFVLRASSIHAEGMTPEQVADLRMVSDAAISPNGGYIAYVLRIPKKPIAEASGSSKAELHVVFPNGISRPFVTGDGGASQIGWTPDGTGISFLAKRSGDKASSLYVIPIDGGEAQRVLTHASGIRSYTYSPDDNRVAFLASLPAPAEEKKLKDKGFNQEIYEEQFRPVRIFVAELGSKDKPNEVKVDGFPSELHWGPAGSNVAVYLQPTPLVDDFYMKRKVHIINLDSSKVVAKFENPGKLGSLAWNASGSHLAFISAEDLNDPSAGRLMIGDVKTSKFQQIALGVDGDYDAIAWRGDKVAYLASVGVTTRVGAVGLDGKHEVVLAEGTHVLSGLSISSDGRTIACLGESPNHPNEVMVMSEGNSAPTRLTNSNPWLADVKLAQQEVVVWKARDGLELEGILVRPLNEKPGTRYPLILCVHGGPESHIDNGWITYYSRPGQVGAAQGFATFYPNYRGSTGRGVKFSKLGQADYAGKEFDDLVDAVDHFARAGLADKKKVGITGGSYGGYASAWGATKLTKHFAASVMFVGISNTISKSGTTDIPNEMFLVHARKELVGNWQWFLERSPIYYVDQARTPLLILHGKEDTRVHPSQSMELYRQLKILGKTPVRLVFYPGEGHGNRKSAARYDYNLRMMRWFEHYLKGKGGEPPSHQLKYPLDKKAKKL
ncbi:MAG: S9 family peptidase [Planctomycetota bacterium]